jgi:ribosome maturation factor RimP
MKSAYQKSMEEKITALLSPVISEANYELVELQLVPRKSSSLLRVLVDRVGGITLDECAELSHRISYVLEVEDPIENRYTLEVSSPGLDRPLTTVADFRRKAGELILLSLREGDRVNQVEGKIVKVEGDQVVLSVDDSEQRFSLTDIVKGKIIF